jgi:hypothetical protein
MAENPCGRNERNRPSKDFPSCSLVPSMVV